MKSKILLLTFIFVSTLFLNSIAQDKIDLEFKESKSVGNELHFKFLLTNNTSSSDLLILLNDTKLYDDEGNSFTSVRIHLGEKEKVYGAVQENCPKGIPMKLKIVFKDAASNLKKIKQLNFTLKEYGGSGDYTKTFENIDVPTTTNEKVLKASNDPMYFEIEDGVFAKHIKSSKNNKIVTAEFMIENTNYDKEIVFNFNGTRIIDDLGNVSKVKTMTFGSMVKTYGGVSQKLPQNVPVKLLVTFELIDPSASILKVLDLGKPGNMFQLKDIKL
jgi:hypothetical protein